ncbi:hypothetical protein IQ254_17335 [Nodosilinea sp. LEGE 07088]|uniref:hypothetical protein n=1 Tax=Nodosilinea sp. LEGE 07088 TaxID=2777968 RepID=UPI00187F9B83|nr:hypothetical protein [Nodosilinea sp. LEGE 07088]MBE9138934.1 hypothetical protein [Nodosilinea sp. LEGE 07088]
MNRDSDIREDILLKLLLEPLAADDSPSGTRFSPAADADRKELDDAPTPSVYSGFEPSTPTPAAPGEVAASHNPVFDSGDLSTVQSHFEALLKRRLRQEISHRPPLFPWEKSVQEYPDALHPGAASIWLDHLSNLSVPAEVPQKVLRELFNHCQQTLHDINQTGRRLVVAVESLFPDQPQTLEYIAGLVARPAYRSAQAETLEQLDYETASTPQQVALAMLAAQNIFEALSLTLSAASPTQTKTWLTSAGAITVQATYLAAPVPQLEISVSLPMGGHLLLSHSGETLGSERSNAGELGLRVATESGAIHRLDVSLGPDQTSPLSFQVAIAAD